MRSQICGRRVCLGFGALEGKCCDTPGTRWTPYWCPSCDDARRAHISKSLEAIAAKMGVAVPGKPARGDSEAGR